MMRNLPMILAIGLAAYLLSSLLTGTARDRLDTAILSAKRAADLEVALSRRLDMAETGETESILSQEVIWPASDRGAVGLLMQQELVEIAARAKVALLSFGLGATEPETDLPVVAFDLELEGGHEEVAAFLLGIESAQPPFAVSYFWVRPLPTDPARPIAPVNVRLTLWGFGGGDQAAP